MTEKKEFIITQINDVTVTNLWLTKIEDNIRIPIKNIKSANIHFGLFGARNLDIELIDGQKVKLNVPFKASIPNTQQLHSAIMTAIAFSNR